VNVKQSWMYGHRTQRVYRRISTPETEMVH